MIMVDIFNHIGATSGRNDKEEILRFNKDNELFKEVLQFVYNPYITTGIASKKLKKHKTGNNTESNPIKTTQDLLTYLRINPTGKDVDLQNVVGFIQAQPLEQQEFYSRVATKDMSIGISDSTINKVFGDGFIPTFDVMLAEKYFSNQDKVTGTFVITQKLDGMRCVIVKENGSIKVFSRQGQPIDGLVDILANATLLPDNMVYDGELLAVNAEGLSSKDLYRKTIKLARKEGNKTGLIFNCFDLLPVEDFKRGVCDTLCIERKNNLHSILNNLDDLCYYIVEVPPVYIGSDTNIIVTLLNEAIARNEEGVMINLDLPYLCKRTKNILKVKKMQTCDCIVTGFEEGKNKNEGTLGAILIDYKGNSVKVGGGYSDNMRNEIWLNQEQYLGKIIEVQYFEESNNSKDDKLSLRFPVFLQVRNDKTEPSYF